MPQCFLLSPLFEMACQILSHHIQNSTGRGQNFKFSNPFTLNPAPPHISIDFQVLSNPPLPRHRLV